MSVHQKILNTNAEFIYDTGADLKTRIGSLILRTTHANYIEKISAIGRDVLASFDMTTGQEIDYDRVQLFFEELREKNYTLKSRIQAERIAYELLLFYSITIFHCPYAMPYSGRNLYMKKSYGIQSIDHSESNLQSSYRREPFHI